MLQLGHGDEAVETRCTDNFIHILLGCFNWATAMKPWRPPVDVSCCCLIFTGFNWATAMKPWRRDNQYWVMVRSLVLQLGHGDEAVETS